MDAPAPPFEIARRAPSARLAGIVAGMTGYRETARVVTYQRETAALVIPMIFSFGSPFLIGLGRQPTPADHQSDFAAGLFAGPVHILSNGSAECVQVDFTPLGAYRFFGGAAVDLTARMIPTGDVLGPDAERLRDRLGEADGWQRRFDILEGYIEGRTMAPLPPEVVYAGARLDATGGAVRITDLAQEIGWSRKHFVARFKAHLGLGPKTIARMIRFNHACRLATTEPNGRWAGIAAECGYADQAHLVHDFIALAGEPPTAWARRLGTASGNDEIGNKSSSQGHVDRIIMMPRPPHTS